jgi:hypothetical protein
MARLVSNLAAIRQSVWNKYGRGVAVGWLGDRAHRARRSDHNPDRYGVVHAIDPMVGGSRGAAIARAAIGRWDLSYVIFNRTIWSRAYGWRARRYTGSDPHTGHVHISGRYDSKSANRRVGLNFGGAASKPTPPKPRPRFVLPPWSLGPNVVFNPYLHSTPPYYRTIDSVQDKLYSIGYNVGKGDGRFGPLTYKAVVAFQRNHGLRPTGKIDKRTYDKLRSL